MRDVTAAMLVYHNSLLCNHFLFVPTNWPSEWKRSTATDNISSLSKKEITKYRVLNFLILLTDLFSETQIKINQIKLLYLSVNVFSTFALIRSLFQARIGIWKCWFLRRGENRSTRRKTSRSREENQQQTEPTYDAGSGNRTRDTLVGGERSRHCRSWNYNLFF